MSFNVPVRFDTMRKKIAYAKYEFLNYVSLRLIWLYSFSLCILKEVWKKKKHKHKSSSTSSSTVHSKQNNCTMCVCASACRQLSICKFNLKRHFLFLMLVTAKKKKTKFVQLLVIYFTQFELFVYVSYVMQTISCFSFTLLSYLSDSWVAELFFFFFPIT